MQYYIKDKEWEQIIKCLHQQKGLHTFNVVKLKNFVEAIYYMAKSGCQWRLLSDYYGNWRTKYLGKSRHRAKQYNMKDDDFNFRVTNT